MTTKTEEQIREFWEGYGFIPYKKALGVDYGYNRKDGWHKTEEIEE